MLRSTTKDTRKLHLFVFFLNCFKKNSLTLHAQNDVKPQPSIHPLSSTFDSPSHFYEWIGLNMSPPLHLSVMYVMVLFSEQSNSVRVYSHKVSLWIVLLVCSARRRLEHIV